VKGTNEEDVIEPVKKRLAFRRECLFPVCVLFVNTSNKQVYRFQ